MGLRGLGILNYKTDRQSGEARFIRCELAGAINGVVFDVGANVGNYSVAVKGRFPALDIYAFEPHPTTFGKLVQNTEALGVKSFNLGVGSVEGSLTLYDYANNDGSCHASLHRDVIEKMHKGKSVGHEVRVVSLDDFVKDKYFTRIALLKIDTEGHEYEVLKGAANLIRTNNISMIHFEFNEMNVVSRVFFRDIWEFLPNYDFYRMLPDGLAPIINYSPIFCEIFAYQNIVAKLKTRL